MKKIDVVLFCCLAVGFLLLCHSPESRLFDGFNVAGVLLFGGSAGALYKLNGK